MQRLAAGQVELRAYSQNVYGRSLDTRTRDELLNMELFMGLCPTPIPVPIFTRESVVLTRYRFLVQLR